MWNLITNISCDSAFTFVKQLSSRKSQVLRLPSVVFICVMVGLLLGIKNVYAAKAIPIQIGDWYLEPTIDISYGVSRSTFGDDHQIQDNYLQVQPKFKLSNKNKEREITINYEIDNIGFKKNVSSESLSTYVSGEYKKAVSRNSDVSVELEYEEGNQIQGVRSGLRSTASRRTEVQKPLGFDAKEAVLKYEFYGQTREHQNFSISAGRRESRFQKTELSGLGRDYDSNRVDLRWRYSWKNGNGIFVNANHVQNDYLQDSVGFSQQLDNNETQVMLGFEWRSHKNISLEFGGGIVRKSFENIDLEVDVPAFYGSVELYPTKRDTFRLEGLSNPIESAGFGAFQDYKEIELSWLRRLSVNWSMEASVRAGTVDYEMDARREEFDDFTLLFEYRLNRVADLIFGFRYSNDESNNSEYNYRGSNVFVTYSTGL